MADQGGYTTMETSLLRYFATPFQNLGLCHSLNIYSYEFPKTSVYTCFMISLNSRKQLDQQLYRNGKQFIGLFFNPCLVILLLVVLYSCNPKMILQLQNKVYNQIRVDKKLGNQSITTIAVAQLHFRFLQHQNSR